MLDARLLKFYVNIRVNIMDSVETKSRTHNYASCRDDDGPKETQEIFVTALNFTSDQF